MYQLWVDVGGTFTDCLLVDSAGHRSSMKVLSSGVTKGSVCKFLDPARIVDRSRIGDPEHFWVGFRFTAIAADGSPQTSVVSRFEGQTGTLTLDPPPTKPLGEQQLYELDAGLESPILAARRLLGLGLASPLPSLQIRLGTTRGTNALLTRTGARTGLLVTRGFGDLLRIGTQERPELFALEVCKPEPLTEIVEEVDERLAADGTVLKELTLDSVRKTLLSLRERRVESLAICFLHAYVNDAHERSVEQLARSLGFQHISRSSEVVPLIKLVSRAQTTVLDAYLNPIFNTYAERIRSLAGHSAGSLSMMTSGGQLVSADLFRGRDAVLSGPAGGAVALSSLGDAVAKLKLCDGVIGFDMGGTSTDVCRYQGRLPLSFESYKAGIRIQTPMIAIHTVAAGGGSVCRTEGCRLLVGPESAGAAPGPACYGNGGPLAVTDLNLILGRLLPDQFPFQLSRQAAEKQLQSLRRELSRNGVGFDSIEHLAEGFWRIAINHMAEAVRTVSSAEGADPKNMGLVSFGGAAGQHACAVAEALGMHVIIDHPDASLFSALGMGLAGSGRFVAKSVRVPLESITTESLQTMAESLVAEGARQMRGEHDVNDRLLATVSAELRYLGTDETLLVRYASDCSLADDFAEQHQTTFGYVRLNRPIELVTLRAEVSTPNQHQLSLRQPPTTRECPGERVIRLFFAGRWHDAGFHQRPDLLAGDVVTGPAIVVSENSTLVLQPDWHGTGCEDGTIICQFSKPTSHPTLPSVGDNNEAVELEIVARRLEGIAEQMGEVLRRTAISVNVKERLDYSCAIFDNEGYLVAGAMHVPVHLGAMGHTVREMMCAFPKMSAGDYYVSNNPYAGGSHLPDVTVVAPVFVDATAGRADFYVSNRAHHAEIGGMTPGSMPPDATRLGQEGVIIDKFALLAGDVDAKERLAELLRSGPYPSRTPNENMADIDAQCAAAKFGIEQLRQLARKHGQRKLNEWMKRLLELSADSIDDVLELVRNRACQHSDFLVPGTAIQVDLTANGDKLRIDFGGSGDVHPRGWNATPAIVSAAVLYVVRCLSKRNLPLSEGALRRIEFILPIGVLNPLVGETLADSPAVVAGNVETSQRVVDCLLAALGVAAASQGTMNNLLIGDTTFGYYETICGGTGATANRAGADAVHSHMTNTRITDPEILESRYPLRLWEFAIRRGSGGRGLHHGGDGVIREIECLRPLSVSLLTSRREPPAPSGMNGGQPGQLGKNVLIRGDGQKEKLPGAVTVNLTAGERIRLETPGGGGFGAIDSSQQ